MATREQIRARLEAAGRLKQREVVLPLLGDDPVIVQEFTAAQAAEFAAAIEGVDDKTPQGKMRVAAELLVRTLRDQEGERIFGDEEADIILGLPIEAFNALAPVAAEVTGVTEVAQLEDVGND
ncbi:MAG: hypothetical protein EA417_01790 [Gammaproteobacteria bacterium]|nr:MAG: hypothetical protein EA417_01790 [Gammaproteobacteria bacterium]